MPNDQTKTTTPFNQNNARKFLHSQFANISIVSFKTTFYDPDRKVQEKKIKRKKSDKKTIMILDRKSTRFTASRYFVIS